VQDLPAPGGRTDAQRVSGQRKTRKTRDIKTHTHKTTRSHKQADLQETQQQATQTDQRHSAAQVTGNKQTENKAAVARQRRSTIEQASVTNKSKS
jgi:hypothetical protein